MRRTLHEWDAIYRSLPFWKRWLWVLGVLHVKEME
jgi:hypothetical protein